MGIEEKVPSGFLLTSVETLAGFWIRLASALIDGILLGIIASLLSAIVGFDRPFGGGNLMFNSSNGLQTILGAIYFTYFHGTPAGQTIGNRMMGIRVLDADNGGPIPYSRALIRYLMSLVSAFALLIGYLWMLGDARKQTWHDKVANTLVVRASAYPPPEFGRPAR